MNYVSLIWILWTLLAGIAGWLFCLRLEENTRFNARYGEPEDESAPLWITLSDFRWGIVMMVGIGVLLGYETLFG